MSGENTIDPLVSLTFSVYSNKGVYALLLGSGLSRTSGIPTGWEITLDLIRKVATLERENCDPNPEKWYCKKHGTAPDYSRLLNDIAQTPTERQQLLRSYFEPTEDERAQNQKTPTKAHLAIAKLVASGYIRVIITTNFDQLTEKALQNAGISPTVISTTDQLKGALPLVHSGVTLIKLHGDYLDTRIKNTCDELSAYESEMDKLLDRVLDEYGLIVCGWSGDWDTALRKAIERCPTRRFTTYWTAVSELSEKAQALASSRRAIILRIQDANHFFESMLEKVQSLEDMASPHPLSAKIATACVKRYIVDPASKIRLHDLVQEETEKLFKEINSPRFGGNAQQEELRTEIPKRAVQYRSLCDTLLHILVTGCYWGSSEHTRCWSTALQRIADIESIGGYVCLTKFRRYPALLLFYGAGIAAIASGNYQTLASLLLNTKVKNENNKKVAACSGIFAFAVLGDKHCFLPEYENNITPVSDLLSKELREPLLDYLPAQEDYDNTFDRFEYLLGLSFLHLNYGGNDDKCWGPVGRFMCRGRHYGFNIAQQIGNELTAAGANWLPLKAGFFNGSIDQAIKAKAMYDAYLS
jgi:hypothetical protein